MKRFIKFFTLTALILLAFTATFGTASAGDKVGVCKYSNKPGEGEILQTFNEVSSSTLKGWDGQTFPYEFTDAQGFSIAIGWAGEVSEEDCPVNPEPPEEPEPKVRLTFLCKAPEDGWANAYVGGGVFEAVEVTAGDYLFRVKNEGNVDFTGYEVFKAGTSHYVGGGISAGEVDFFSLDYAIAGLHVVADPYAKHGTSSTNETPCEMVDQPEDPGDDEPEISNTCQWKQYILRDKNGHICSIIRNPNRGDRPGQLPTLYNNTQLMRITCSSDCNGNPMPWKFGKLDTFWTGCQVCDEGCR